jgi:uncharacterized protein YydD (DUF2326 family)
MLQIKKLYTEPASIDPVEFSDGLNFIMGEKDDSSSKNNGVGKSLCIEFINFALLKQKAHSRVSKIPKESFNHDTKICLDIIINKTPCTIKRSIADAERPTIIMDGTATTFAKLEDATLFFTEKLFNKDDLDHPSIREILGPLIRDEKSEFKSLVSCFDTKLTIPDNYGPHLFLLGIDTDLYRAVKTCISQIDDISKEIKRIEENVHLLRQKDIADARSDLNDLDSEVAAIQASIEKLENTTGFDMVKDEIIELEERIGELRRQKAIIKHNLMKLKPVSEKVQIDSDELREFYEQLKQGLGNLIAKELNEIIDFKQKIEEFQNHLLAERKKGYIADLTSVDENIATLDKRYTENLKVLDQNGSLKNLKQTYAAYQTKFDELGQLRSFLSRHEDLEIKKQKIKSQKESDLLELQASISAAKETISSFEKTILDVHEFIQGSRKASFEVKPTGKKQVVEINMRIDDDGSHSVERAKVFIYDISLIINERVKHRHPGILIHDNIFEVDQDTLINSLRFLTEKVRFDSSQQYIVTLNSDRLEAVYNEPWYKMLDSCIVARFTKNDRFLKNKYQEVS